MKLNTLGVFYILKGSVKLLKLFHNLSMLEYKTNPLDSCCFSCGLFCQQQYYLHSILFDTLLCSVMVAVQRINKPTYGLNRNRKIHWVNAHMNKSYRESR